MPVFMDSSAVPDADVAALRAELLSSVAAIFDRAVELGRRQGAEAVLATINDAARKMAGLSGGFAVRTHFSGTLSGLPGAGEDQAPPTAGPATAGRARNGSVQGAVLEILARSPKPLAPLRVVDEGRVMGHDLKTSSVRMALIALSKQGRVEQNALGDYHLAPGRDAARSDAPDADANPTA